MQRPSRAASEAETDVDTGSAFFAHDDGGQPPALGEVYLSDTSILHELEGRDRRDRKDDRPVVVVREPTRAYPRVHVCVRESMKKGRPIPDGVRHAADGRLRLTLPGVWLPNVKFAHVEDFTGDAVEYRDFLDEDVFKRVMEMVARGRV